jgi:hypothetical protein
MNNPQLLLFLFSGIGITIGMFTIALTVIRALKASPQDTSAVLFSAAFYFFPLMTKLLYAFVLTVVASTQANLIGQPIIIAGLIFGAVAILQGLLGMVFIRPTVKQTRTESFSQLPLRLAAMGTIETIATLTMVFTIILSQMPAK